MRTIVAAVLVSGLVSACAVSPEEDPVQIKLNDLEGRLQRIERANQSVVEMAQKLDATQSELRSLRGTIDELQNNNDALKRQQRELYSDLDKRLAAASAAGSVAGGIAGAGGGAPGAPVGGSGATGGSAVAEQAAYSQAFDALKASNYAVAITGFESFLSTYPSSPIAENAQYWLGEAHYAKGEYDRAAQSFRAVGERWPNSRKSPDALLKLGFSQIEMKRFSEARVTLADVTRKFPDSDAAKLAAERLRKLPADAR
ncbi:MAG: tol-pal system protein YbgF [Gammaproteobacteria bacterium]